VVPSDGAEARLDPQIERIDSLFAELAVEDPVEAAAQKHLLNARVIKAIDAQMDAVQNKNRPLTLEQAAWMERRIARLAAERLEPGDGQREVVHWLGCRLIDAYRRLDRDDLAVRIAEDLLSGELSRADRIVITMEYCWMKILAGRPAEAIRLVDRFIDKNSKDYDPALRPMLVDRARLSAALGQYDQAEAEVDRVLREMPPESLTYSSYAQAYLLRGALWDRRNEPEKALEAWRMGCYRKWTSHDTTDPAPVLKRDSRAATAQNFVSYYMIVLGSAAGELTAEELAFALQFGLQELSDVITQSKLGLNFLSRNLDFISTPFLVKAVSASYQTRRGRSFVHRMAFDQVSYTGRVVEAFLHAVLSVVRHSAMTDGIPDDVEPALWESMLATLDDFEKKKLNEAHFAQFVATYSGVTNLFGWAGLRPALRPEILPAIAFMMGHRYRTLKDPKDARMFFELVLEKAPVDSPLRRWSSKVIERIDQAKN
jgi:tetratricopeptide (TPR) repeat protein